MGEGRHTRVLVELGFRTFGVDRDQARVGRAYCNLRTLGQKAFLWVADLDYCPLAERHFDLVLCSRYLQRNLWAELAGSVKLGGFVIYETFTTHQRQYDWGPHSSDHLLQPGELRDSFKGWEIWVYDERQVPAGEARLVARKPLKR